MKAGSFTDGFGGSHGSSWALEPVENLRPAIAFHIGLNHFVGGGGKGRNRIPRIARKGGGSLQGVVRLGGQFLEDEIHRLEQSGSKQRKNVTSILSDATVELLKGDLLKTGGKPSQKAIKE